MKLYEVQQAKIDEIVDTQVWVRYVRKSGKVVFLQCYDGTTDEDTQFVVPKDKYLEAKRGDYLKIFGVKVTSKGTQEYEILVDKYEVVSRPEAFPLEKKDASIETLREIPHFRCKTTTSATILKLRSLVELGLSQYFDEKKITKVTPPLITPSDCEGAGETFSLGKDFFKKSAYLTVSSQMYLEAMVRSLSQVYCLAPAFRADPSLSPRHLAEFWMLEVEMISDQLEEIIQEAQELIQQIGKILLQHPQLLQHIDKGLVEKIEKKISTIYKRITYAEACTILGKEIKGSKEEKELMEKLDSSIILTHFPSDQKPFYMKTKGKETYSFDILVKGVGEVVGGSLREEDAKILEEKMTSGMKSTLDWYLAIRKVDKIPTGGFGLGLERVLMFYLEQESIKEISPFPRWFGRMDV